MRVSWLWIVMALGTMSLPAAGNDLAAARSFLNRHQLREATAVQVPGYARTRERIAGTRDPGTKFGYVVFSLAREKTGVLNPQQLERMEAIIAERQQGPVDWHDVRNIIRVQAMLRLFPHALAEDGDEREAIRREWDSWTDLRQAYMFQEFIAQERFQRAAWAVLTAAQKKALLSGEFDGRIKKSTGHSRAFFADRIVRRALGDPDDPAAFATAAKEWRERWQAVQGAMQAAEKMDRQREFAMDLAGEDFAVATWQADAPVFRSWAEAERDAIRDLVQAGYVRDEALREQVRQWIEQQRSDMVAKYRENATDLLRQLGELPSKDP